MSKRKRSRKRAGQVPAESSAAEAITVFWLLAALAALVAELGGLAAQGVSLLAGEAAAEVQQLAAMFGGILLGIAVISGSACLIATPIVLRWRRLRPTHGLTVFVCVVAVLPWAALVLMWLSQHTN